MLALLVGCTVLAACTDSGDDPGGQSTSDPSPSATEEGPLSVFVYGDERKVEAYQRIADAYAASEDGSRVDLHVYDDAQAGADAALTGLRAEFGPDVFLLDHTYLPEFVDPPLVEPLDELLEERGLQFGDDYQRVALTALSANSGLQCMPAEISPLVVYYNRDLLPLDELGELDIEGIEIPDGTEGWSWDSFETIARGMAGIDRLGPIKGASIPSNLDAVAAFIRSAGGDIVDDEVEPSRLDLGSEDAVETIATLANFARDPSVSLTPAQLERKPPVDWFADGQLGMFIGTRADLPKLRDAPGLRFDAAPLPSFGASRSTSTINGWCVNAASQRIDEAADFIAFAVGREAQRIAARSDVIVPSRLDVVNSDVFLDPGEEPRSSQVYGTSIRRSDPMPFDKGWPSAQRAADVVLGRLFTNPFLDLEETLAKRLERLDTASEVWLGGEEEEE